MERSDEGTIILLDKKVPNQKVIENIGYTAQADALYTDLSAEENMKFYCRLYKIPKKERNARIDECLSIVNLKDDKKKIVNNFSGGMKRRLSLAISLIHRPKVLILDEPTVGMDPLLRRQIWQELYRFRSGKMILKKIKIKYAAIFFLCWFALLVFLVDGVLKFQTLVDFFGSYILVEIALLLLVILPTWTVYKFTEER